MDAEGIRQLQDLLIQFFEEERGMLIDSEGTPVMLISRVEHPKDNQYGKNRTLVKGVPLDGREDPVEEFLDWKNPYKNDIEPVIYEDGDGIALTQRTERGKEDDEEAFEWLADKNSTNRLKELQDKMKLKEQSISDLQDQLDEKIEENEEFRRNTKTVNEKLRGYKSRIQSLSSEVNELRKENEMLRKDSERFEAKKREEKGERDAKMQKAEQRGRDEEKDRLDHAMDGVKAVGDLNEEFAKASANHSDRKVERKQEKVDGEISKVNEKIGSLEEEISDIKQTIE